MNLIFRKITYRLDIHKQLEDNLCEYMIYMEELDIFDLMDNELSI